MKSVVFILLTLGVLSAGNSDAHADSERFMFVVDGSGSMWQEINGVTKISSASEVMTTLIDDLNDDVEVGLVTYGHRQKGECADIETLIPLGPLDRAAIKSAVNNISPKGKTPLSAAVIKAAEELKYTEERATVVLISDGRETCNMDPCAIGSELDRTGIDFTTHVIGFDVAEADDQAQLQCLAENTGGIFLTASNAEELTVALRQIAAVVIAPPVIAPPVVEEFRQPVQTFTATGEVNFNADSAEWTLTNKETEVVLIERSNSNRLEVNLPPGPYEVSFRQGSSNGRGKFDVVEGSDGNFSIAVEQTYAPVIFDAPEQVALGTTIPVGWDGRPDGERGYISIGKPGDPNSINWRYTSDGNPVNLLMPNEPGEYEIRYVLQPGDKVLWTRPITITDVTVTLDAPLQVPAGITIPVEWVGPNALNDYIQVSKPGNPNSISWRYTSEGNPVNLPMPKKSGDYEIRYVLRQDRKVMATKAILVK